MKKIICMLFSLSIFCTNVCVADDYEEQQYKKWLYDKIQVKLVNQKSSFLHSGKLDFLTLRELCYMIFTEAERQNIQIVIDSFKPNKMWCDKLEPNDVDILFTLVLEANDYLYHDATTALLLGKTTDEEVPYCMKQAASSYCGFLRYSVNYRSICKQDGSAEEIHCSGDRCVVNQRLDCKDFGTQYWNMCCKMDLNTSADCPDYITYIHPRSNAIKGKALTLSDYDSDCYIIQR